MKNIVTKLKCFKSQTPTLIDVVFTSVPKRFISSTWLISQVIVMKYIKSIYTYMYRIQ